MKTTFRIALAAAILAAVSATTIVPAMAETVFIWRIEPVRPTPVQPPYVWPSLPLIIQTR